MTLSITSFHDWFEGCVSDWVGIAQNRVKDRLKRAVELDTIVKTSDNAPFSSSAVDTHAFFLQVMPFFGHNYLTLCFYVRLLLSGKGSNGQIEGSH